MGMGMPQMGMEMPQMGMERPQMGIQCFESLRGKNLQATTGHPADFSNSMLPSGAIRDRPP